MNWHIRVPLTGHNDVPHFLAGPVCTIGVFGARHHATVCDFHARAALVAVGLSILTGDISLVANGLDFYEGLVDKGVHWLAPSLCHIPMLHHLVAVVGVVAGVVAWVHVLPLELHGP